MKWMVIRQLVGGWLRRWGLNVLLGATIAGWTALTVYAFNYVLDAEGTKTELAVEKKKLELAETVARFNQFDLENCLAVNESNRWEAQIQARRAFDAELRVAELHTEKRLLEKEIAHEAEKFEGRGLGCPAFDDEFLDWLLE